VTVVAAQPVAPPVVGLITSARTTPAVNDEPGWERGLAWAPECPGGYRALSDCTAEVIDLDQDRPGPVDYQPWTLEVEESCSTRDVRDAEAETDERLRRRIAAVESYAIGRELMLGELTRADVAAAGRDTPNVHLTQAGRVEVLTAAPTAPALALGLLEEALGHALRGAVGYLHVPLVATNRILNLQYAGNLRTTPRGTQVVLEAGYPNVAPAADGAAPADAAAGSAWVYATGLVVVRRGPVFQDAPDRAQTLDRASNVQTRKVARRVAAHFDPCALFAAQITLEG
jgi:hypothetical protein